MDEQPERSQVTVRCRRCRAALARMVPEPPPVGWRVDRIDRVPFTRQPWTLGVSGLGDLAAGLACIDGTLATRALPVPVQLERTSLACRRCGLSSTPTLAELRARADRAQRKRKTVMLFP